MDVETGEVLSAETVDATLAAVVSRPAMGL